MLLKPILTNREEVDNYRFPGSPNSQPRSDRESPDRVSLNSVCTGWWGPRVTRQHSSSIRRNRKHAVARVFAPAMQCLLCPDWESLRLWPSSRVVVHRVAHSQGMNVDHYDAHRRSSLVTCLLRAVLQSFATLVCSSPLTSSRHNTHRHASLLSRMNGK